ncbi:hypothetical protein, partial [Desulfobacter curvatus]|uniref:hypothetical protein n=1 Tax=Desulfobacter curvatus TaxID=2290 RepID=UPI001B7F900D
CLLKEGKAEFSQKGVGGTTSADLLLFMRQHWDTIKRLDPRESIGNLNVTPTYSVCKNINHVGLDRAQINLYIPT